MRTIFSLALSAIVFLGATPASHGATMAIVDTGVIPGSIGGALAEGGFDFYNNDADPLDDEPEQHGTEAARSALSAASVTIVPIKAYGSNFETSQSVLDESFRYAATLGVKAVAHSIGAINNASLGALQAVTNSGAVLVVQGGNAATSSPTGDATKVPALGGRGIIAVGLFGGSIWSASARAGSLKDYVLAADVISPAITNVGTSMATPRIAAVAGKVAETHAFLSPNQVVQILFESATDLGAPGVDAVYGHGEVNLNAALSAVGAGEIPVTDGGDTSGGGGGGGGGGSGVAIAALAVGGAVAYTMFNKKEDLKKTIFVDKFGRAFNIDLADRATTRSNTPLLGLFNGRQNPISMVRIPGSGLGQTVAFINDPFPAEVFNLEQAADETRHISVKHQFNGVDTEYTMGLNADLSSDFGALSLARNESSSMHQGRFLYNDVFTTPILGYSSQGSTFRFGWNNDLSSHRLGVAVIDDQEENGLQSNSILYENTMEKDAFKLGFQMGALVEDGNLFGGSSNGAFSADQTSTYYLGLNGALKLSGDISLIGGYFQGLSKVDESAQSLVDQFSDIRTEGYGVGVLVDNALSHRGSFGLSYSSPMQTTDGSARLTLPTSQNRLTGAIGFESSNISFQGADQEKIIEAYYGWELSRQSDIFAHFSHTRNPVSNPDMENDNTFYIGWKRAF